MDQASTEAASPPSPVSWQTLVWILLSLGINSMAQPSGRICGVFKMQSRHRIYLSSSPIICLADAVEQLARCLVLMIYLWISPRQACQLALLDRSYMAIDDDGYSLLAEDSDVPQEEGAEISRWPRWIFFIIGALPAVIKVASFSGTPWSKAWAMMFAVSFVLTEILSVLGQSKDPEETRSLAAILGLSDIEFADPKHDILRGKSKNVIRCVAIADAIFFLIALMTHLVLVSWAVIGLWNLAIVNEDVINIVAIMKSTWSIWILILLLCSLILKCIGRFPNGELWKWFVYSIFGLIVIPDLGKDKSGFDLFTLRGSVILLVYGMFWLMHFSLKRVSKKWPWVARGLLIDDKTWVGSKAEGEESEASEVAEALEASKAPESKEEPRVSAKKTGPIDENSWIAFCIFQLNLATTVLWYAFKYNPTGTVNPSWTTVFG